MAIHLNKKTCITAVKYDSIIKYSVIIEKYKILEYIMQVSNKKRKIIKNYKKASSTLQIKNTALNRLRQSNGRKTEVPKTKKGTRMSKIIKKIKMFNSSLGQRFLKILHKIIIKIRHFFQLFSKKKYPTAHHALHAIQKKAERIIIDRWGAVYTDNRFILSNQLHRLTKHIAKNDKQVLRKVLNTRHYNKTAEHIADLMKPFLSKKLPLPAIKEMRVKKTAKEVNNILKDKYKNLFKQDMMLKNVVNDVILVRTLSRV